ncbi:MAG: hypothetical protein G01um101438_283 [Parcubacteria group bacterium Gr01-1014_38]|nr:MAG: hypothetical protein G01um101438_283 [Parcubacteria group bacterium Gr01-1014_38]
MFRRAGWLLRWVLFLVAAWAALVYGLPAFRARLPDLCARWNLQGGVCSPPVQETLGRVQEWTESHLVPLSRDARFRASLRQVQRAFQHFETLLRRQVGNARVDAAFRGADVGLRELERLFGDDREIAREKIAAVPGNTRELLRKAREAFDRLRALLSSTGRRADEVSSAVDEAQQALDALSTALPGKNE